MSGGQGPTIVFIHGAGSSADFWYEQRTAFPSAHYLSLPGHERGSGIGGRRLASLGDPSPASNTQYAVLATPYSVDDYADWVQQYVEGRDLRNVVLDGHSMGGAVTQTIALRSPGWLSAIVLTGTGARLRVLPRLIELLRTDYPAAVELIIEQSFAPIAGPLTYKQKIRRNGVRRQTLRTPREVILNDYEACDRFDLMERVHEISVPTLCIVGAQDLMTPPKYSAYLQMKIKGARLESIEGAGHMLPLEQPGEYNRRVLTFLASLSAA